MASTTAPPPYSLTEDRKTKPFAEVAKPVWDKPIFKEVLKSFKAFLSSQEIATVSK
ncbi:hypothetical protein FRC12_017419 [Ceratobasidium sp. 428]|nr:hypothetical protein FRC12_017419 [Ceratobasidium sp. 428]